MPTSHLSGKRVAIFGLGRSGLTVAQACLKFGAIPTVYDETSSEKNSKPDLITDAEKARIKLVLGQPFGQVRDDLIVVNPAIDKRHLALQNALQPIYSEIEFAYQISNAPIVAITGTNGKSTTTAMVHMALLAAGIDSVLCGNIFGSGLKEQTLTEAAMNSREDQILVAEISSFQLEWIHEFRPAVAAITTITEDHLNRYESFQDYANTKMRIWQVQQTGDYAVVRANDAVVIAPGKPPEGYRPRHQRTQASAENKQTVWTFGATGEQARNEGDHLILFGRRLLETDFQVVGSHNIANIGTAALISYAALKVFAQAHPESHPTQLLRQTLEDRKAELLRRKSKFENAKDYSDLEWIPEPMVDALKQFRGLEHRMEFVAEKDGVKYINNSMCTNPAAVLASVQALKANCHVLMGGVNKGLDFRPLASFFRGPSHKVYLFGQDAKQICEELGGEPPVYVTMREAFDAATKVAKSGEIVMLAPGCASMDQFGDFRDRGNVFRQYVTDWTE